MSTQYTIEDLKQIVDALPNNGDGHPIVPGMTLWIINLDKQPEAVKVESVAQSYVMIVGWEREMSQAGMFSSWSSRESAVAALALHENRII